MMGPMETEFYMTRHGQTEWNKKMIYQGQMNSPLTKLGVSQAESLRSVLEEINPDIIISSPLGRALETCQIAAGARREEIIQADEMMEINMGLLSGRTMEQLEEDYPEVYKLYISDDENYKIPSGESPVEVADRVFAFMDNTAEKYPGKKIFILTHGCVLAIIRNRLNNRPLRPYNGHDIKNAQCIKIIKKKVYTVCDA